jgi:hypothetical protein
MLPKGPGRVLSRLNRLVRRAGRPAWRCACCLSLARDAAASITLEAGAPATPLDRSHLIATGFQGPFPLAARWR